MLLEADCLPQQQQQGLRLGPGSWRTWDNVPDAGLVFAGKSPAVALLGTCGGGLGWRGMAWGRCVLPQYPSVPPLLPPTGTRLDTLAGPNHPPTHAANIVTLQTLSTPEIADAFV